MFYVADLDLVSRALRTNLSYKRQEVIIKYIYKHLFRVYTGIQGLQSSR